MGAGTKGFGQRVRRRVSRMMMAKRRRRRAAARFITRKLKLICAAEVVANFAITRDKP